MFNLKKIFLGVVVLALSANVLCANALFDLKWGQSKKRVEKYLKKRIPELKKLVAISYSGPKKHLRIFFVGDRNRYNVGEISSEDNHIQNGIDFIQYPSSLLGGEMLDISTANSHYSSQDSVISLDNNNPKAYMTEAEIFLSQHELMPRDNRSKKYVYAIFEEDMFNEIDFPALVKALSVDRKDRDKKISSENDTKTHSNSGSTNDPKKTEDVEMEAVHYGGELGDFGKGLMTLHFCNGKLRYMDIEATKLDSDKAYEQLVREFGKPKVKSGILTIWTNNKEDIMLCKFRISFRDKTVLKMED